MTYLSHLSKSGEITGKGYTFFHFTVEVKRKHYWKDFGKKQWLVEEVYVEEYKKARNQEVLNDSLLIETQGG